MPRRAAPSASAATRRASSAGSSPASGSSPSASWPSSSSALAAAGALGEADAGVGGELGQLVGAPLRLQQVGGDHRVVVELELDPLAGGGGEQAVAAAAERLQVVGGERAAVERDRELVEGRGAGRGSGRPGPRPSGRRRSPSPRRPVAQVLRACPRPPRPRARSRRCGREPPPPRAAPSSSRSITARSSNSRMKSRRVLRSGSRAIASPRSMPVSMSYCSVASCFESRASSACSTRFCLRLAPEILLDAGEHLLQRAELLQQLRRRLLADPGDAGDVVGGVAVRPIRSVTSSGGTP